MWTVCSTLVVCFLCFETVGCSEGMPGAICLEGRWEELWHSSWAAVSTFLSVPGKKIKCWWHQRWTPANSYISWPSFCDPTRLQSGLEALDIVQMHIIAQTFWNVVCLLLALNIVIAFSFSGRRSWLKEPAFLLASISLNQGIFILLALECFHTYIPDLAFLQTWSWLWSGLCKSFLPHPSSLQYFMLLER